MSRRRKPGMPIEEAVSAGGVVYRRGPQGIEVVICGRTKDGVWGLPKGTPAPGESLEETAAREVAEETGLQVRPLAKIGTIEYWFVRPQEKVRVHKRVHHYLMVPTGGSVEQHDWEYDLVEWVPIEEAIQRLTYPNEAEVVRQAQRLIEEVEGHAHPQGRRGGQGEEDHPTP
jgi:8-oxo-dGTP pyrophosphatase MutT (NUDIX family)